MKYVQTIQNTLFTERVVDELQRRLTKIDSDEMLKLIESSRDDAIKIALTLAAQPPPPKSMYVLEDKYTTSEGLGNLIDDALAAETSFEEFEYGERGEKKNNPDFASQPEGDIYGELEAESVDIPDDVTKLCLEWKTTFDVVPGVSWGTLPLDLQVKWKAYACDAYQS